MGRFTCRSCKGPLPGRGARCRNCGWASKYDARTGSGRQSRELRVGVGLMVAGLSMALAIAVIAYIGSA
jgi:hypothetical protein